MWLRCLAVRLRCLADIALRAASVTHAPQLLRKAHEAEMEVTGMAVGVDNVSVVSRCTDGTVKVRNWAPVCVSPYAPICFLASVVGPALFQAFSARV